MPRSNRHARRQIRLPKTAGYSAQQVEEFLAEEEHNGFRTELPEGCNFVIVSMPKAVMSAYRDRERAYWAAKRKQ